MTNKAIYKADYDMGNLVRSEELGFAGENDGIGKADMEIKFETLNRRQIDSINKIVWQICNNLITF